jgi:hypothetical protein
MGVSDEIATDTDAPIDRDMRVQYNVVSEFDVLVHKTERPDARIFAEKYTSTNHSC